MKKPPPGAPWAPVAYEGADVGAIQALNRGDATPEQQRRALRYIVEVVAGTYDQSFRPDSERDTAFAEGRRFVGLTLVKLSKINPQLLRKNTDGRSANRDPSRSPGSEFADDTDDRPDKPGPKPGGQSGPG